LTETCECGKFRTTMGRWPGQASQSNCSSLTMKVAELRAELASRGLDTKGKKAELEARLQETAVLGADGADASTCIAAPAPPTKTTVAKLRAELASRGMDTKGKKAELEARLLEPETSAAQLTAELRDLKAEHEAEHEAKLAEHEAKKEAKVAEHKVKLREHKVKLRALEAEHRALEAEHRAEVDVLTAALHATKAKHGAEEAVLAAALAAQQAKEHEAREFEEWRKKINDASFDGSFGCRDCGKFPAGAAAVAAIVASGKCALIRDISLRTTNLVDTDVAALAEHCGKLSSIDLEHCAHLTNAAVAAFADACRRRAAAGCGQLGSITFRGCNLIDEGALGAVGTLEGCGVKVEHSIGEVWVVCTECEEFVEEGECFECEGCSVTICNGCFGLGATYERTCQECGVQFCKECFRSGEHIHFCNGEDLACGYTGSGYDESGECRHGCDEYFCQNCVDNCEGGYRDGWRCHPWKTRGFGAGV
jgi:hypothetical protein